MRHARPLIICTVAICLLATSGAFALSPVLKEMEDAFIRLHEELQPSVVNIESTTSSVSSECPRPNRARKARVCAACPPASPPAPG
jgi:hypothetical protein